MNLDAVSLALIVGLAIAIVEGIKQAFESLANKELPSGAKVILSVVTGTALASVAEFAPETWVRIIPILTAGLAAAGLYSISKRVGNGAATALQTTRLIGQADAFTLLDGEEDGLVNDEDWANFLNGMEPGNADGSGPDYGHAQPGGTDEVPVPHG